MPCFETPILVKFKSLEMESRIQKTVGRKWVVPNGRLEMYNVVAHFSHFGEMKMAVIYL